MLLRVSAPVRKILIQFRQQPRTHVKQQFFHFRTETLFSGKFVPKNQNYQFKLKFAAQTNSNMQNSMVLFTFSVSDRKYRFLSKFGTKIQNCFFNVEFSTYIDLNTYNSLVLFNFFLQTGNTLCGQIQSKKQKI